MGGKSFVQAGDWDGHGAFGLHRLCCVRNRLWYNAAMRQGEEKEVGARPGGRPISAYRFFPGVQSHLPFRLRPGLFRHRVLPTLVPVQLLQPPFFGRRGHGHRWSERCSGGRDCACWCLLVYRAGFTRATRSVFLWSGFRADDRFEPAVFARFVFRQRRDSRPCASWWEASAWWAERYLDILLRTASNRDRCSFMRREASPSLASLSLRAGVYRIRVRGRDQPVRSGVFRLRLLAGHVGLTSGTKSRARRADGRAPASAPDRSLRRRSELEEGPCCRSSSPSSRMGFCLASRWGIRTAVCANCPRRCGPSIRCSSWCWCWASCGWC